MYIKIHRNNCFDTTLPLTLHKTFFTQTSQIIHQNCLCLFLHNHIWFSRNKSSMHGVIYENILALHPVFSCYWCPYISCSHLLCILVCWAAVNHLCTLSHVVKFTSSPSPVSNGVHWEWLLHCHGLVPGKLQSANKATSSTANWAN